MQASDPIIIFGAPRSGTTYLNAIINKHPRVFVTHESRIFAWLNSAINLTERPQMVNTHKAEFVDHLRRTMPDVVRSFYAELRPGVDLWGDKNPHYASPENVGTLPLIKELFPGTRFLHIIRDGRDVVTSLIRKRKPTGEPWIDFESAHRVWIGHVDMGTGFGQTLDPADYFELRYEDLITDDLGWAGKALEFLGLKMTPGVEQFCAQQAAERTPLSGPTRELADVGRSDWADVLDAGQRRQSLSLIGEHLVRYGYETVESLAALEAGA